MTTKTPKRRNIKKAPNRKKQSSELATVSSRIRYARVDNNIDPSEMMQLLKKRRLKVSKQLLSLYETSAPQNPNLKIIEGISKVTGYSTNWLLFGTAPVKNLDPFLQIVRFTNFKTLCGKSGNKVCSKKECESAGVSWELFQQHYKTPFIPSMSDEFARGIEIAAKKPVGWLDEAPKELNNKEFQKQLTDIQEIISASLSLNEEQRKAMISFLSALDD